MKIKAIVAINNKGYIGKDGSLLWHCPKDLQHFKKMTYGHCVIVGRKTFDSLKSPLQGREIFVASRNSTSLDECLRMAKIVAQNKCCDIWIIGGGEIYQQTMNYWQELHISKINNDLIGDVKFPNYDYLMNCQVFEYKF